MAVRITDNTTSVENAITQKASIFLRELTDTIITNSTPKTPMKSGHLRREVLKQVLGLHGTVKWVVNYAAWQEDNQYKKYTTPGTGPHFAQDAVEAAVKDTDVIARRVF